MRRRIWCALLAIAAAWSGGKTIADESSGKAHDDRRPNIVLFVVDDLGWQDSGVSFTDNDTPFQQHFQTPNLWRLAAGGVRLSRAYSCAVCSPTRVSLLTGQNAVRHRVTNWILHADRETSGQTSRLAPPADWRRMGIDDVLTLPMILRQQRYATIHSGKAHFGEVGTPFSDPRNLGFDINIGGHAAGAPGSYQGTKNYGTVRARTEERRTCGAYPGWKNTLAARHS